MLEQRFHPSPEHHEAIKSVESGRLPERVSFDLRDVRGNTIGRLAYDLAPDNLPVTVRGREIPSKEILKVALEYEKDGETRTLDLMDHFSMESIPLRLAKDLPGGHGVNMKGTLILKRLEDQGDIAVLLHEMRHEQQKYDIRMNGMNSLMNAQNLYNPKRVWNHEHIGYLSRIAQDILIQAPELSSKLNVADAISTINKLSRDIPNDGTPDQILAAQERLMSTELTEGVTVRDLISLPMWLSERDADFGALRSLRDIRSLTGVNLLADFPEKKLGFLRTLTPAQLEKGFAPDPAEGPRTKKKMGRIQKSLTDASVGDSVGELIRVHMESIGATNEKLRAVRKTKALRLERTSAYFLEKQPSPSAMLRTLEKISRDYGKPIPESDLVEIKKTVDEGAAMPGQDVLERLYHELQKTLPEGRPVAIKRTLKELSAAMRTIRTLQNSFESPTS